MLAGGAPSADASVGMKLTPVGASARTVMRGCGGCGAAPAAGAAEWSSSAGVRSHASICLRPKLLHREP